MKIVLASSNLNKVREISAILTTGFSVTGLKETGISEEIPETGTTIRENAILKARYVFDRLQGQDDLLVLADDSGLEVDALDGAPGVYSARYAGSQKDDEANNSKLLASLEGSSDRSARFVTVLALISNTGTEIFEGILRGKISMSRRGNAGFGYDPLFVPDGESRTFGEMSPAEKNAISHRAIAVNKLRSYLDSIRTAD